MMAKSLLSKIEQELADIDEVDFQEPDGDMDPQATVVSTLNDYHRRLITLQKQYSDTAEMRFAEGSEATKLRRIELATERFQLGAEASNMAKMLENLLFISLRDEYEDLNGKPGIIIAKGWEIGYLDNEVMMARMQSGSGGFSPMEGPSISMVALGSFIALLCVGVAGAAIAMLVIGSMQSAGTLGLLILAGIVGMFLMRNYEMRKKTRKKR